MSMPLIQKHCDLMIALYRDIVCIHFGSEPPWVARDIRTIQERSKNEGIAFFTKTLPSLASAMERSCETNYFQCPSSFARYKGTHLPQFLQVLFRSLYNEDGSLQLAISPELFGDIRTLLLFMKKVEVPYTASLKDAAIEKFVATDTLLPSTPEEILDGAGRWWIRSSIKWATNFLIDVFKDVDMKSIVPRHGTGAVATGESPSSKRVLSRLFTGIHEAYPYYDYAFCNTTDLLHRRLQYKSLQRCDRSVSKLTLIPKDSKGPRLISIEPLETQFFQQGQRPIIEAAISRHCPGININDQSYNRRGAEEGSIGGHLATLDLSEASDRVSLALVRLLFPSNVLRYIEATRSQAIFIARNGEEYDPDGEHVHVLKKFASMGSALCFPIESLVFYSLLKGLQATLNLNVTKRLLVFGDDIIIAKEYAPFAIELLEAVGLVVNKDKSFINGPFRESCGGDFFKGVNVTPIRLRQLVETKLSPSTLVSIVSTANQLYDRYYLRAAELLRRHAEKACGHRLPTKEPSEGFLGWHSRTKREFRSRQVRWNTSLQRLETKVLVPKGIDYTSVPDGVVEQYAELFRKFTQGWSPEFESCRYSRRKALRIVRLWDSPQYLVA